MPENTEETKTENVKAESGDVEKLLADLEQLRAEKQQLEVEKLQLDQQLRLFKGGFGDLSEDDLLIADTLHRKHAKDIDFVEWLSVQKSDAGLPQMRKLLGGVEIAKVVTETKVAETKVAETKTQEVVDAQQKMKTVNAVLDKQKVVSKTIVTDQMISDALEKGQKHGDWSEYKRLREALNLRS